MLLSALTGALFLLGSAPLALAMAQRFRLETAIAPHLSLAWSALVFWLLLQQISTLLLGTFGFLTMPAAVAVHLGLLAAGLFLCKTSPATDPNSEPGGLRPLWLLAFAFPVILLVFINLYKPTTSYDSMMYHYPIVATWLQDGAFTRFGQWFYISCFPNGYELYLAPFMLASGTDYLALTPNAVFLIYAGLTLYLGCRELGAQDHAARAATMLAMAVTLVPVTLRGAHVDVPLAAFTGGAIYAGLVFLQRGGLPAAALAIANLALLVSVKMSGPAYGILAVAFLAVLLVHRLVKGERFPLPWPANRKTAGDLFTLVVASCFVGGYWYLRNWYELGNPLGFVQLDLGPIHFAPGGEVEAMVRDVQRGSLANVFDSHNREHWNIVGVQLLQQFGVPLLLLLPCALFGLWRCLLARNLRVIGINLLLFSILCVVLYARSPFTADNGGHNWELSPWMGYQMRYGLPAVSFIALLAAFGLSRLPAAVNAALAAVAALWFTVAALFATERGLPLVDFLHNDQIVQSLARVATQNGAMLVVTLLLCTAGAFAAGTLLRKQYRPEIHWILLAITAVTVTAFAIAAAPYGRARAELAGGICEILEEHVPDGATVAYVNSHRAIFLWKKHFRNRVTYVPAPADDLSAWLAALDTKGADFVAIGPLYSRKNIPQELDWLKASSPPNGPFSLLSEGDMYRASLLFSRTR